MNGHRHRLAHFWVAGQHRVVKVEVHRLKGGTGGSSKDRKIVEALVQGYLQKINESGRIDGPCLQVLENGVLSGNMEYYLVQIGQPRAGKVIPGVTHQGVVISGHALSYHKGTTRDPGVRRDNLIWPYSAEMVRRQGRKKAIYPR